MGTFFKLLVVCLLVEQIICPPVKEAKKEDEEAKEGESGDELEDVMEYSRYLKEVVNALESDPTFRDKLEKAEEADIRSGKIAHELEYVSHRVRNRLDEIKRAEVERLRHLASKKQELENGFDSNHLKIDQHLDHGNPHTFEIEDLKKLIEKTSQDLAEADRKRRSEFKQYEMQKEFEKNEKLKTLDDEKRVEMENELKEQEQKHKKHEKLHHPGSKQQLEEVWEKQDHMDRQDFDPKTFFMFHDLDGNDHWDQNEVKALFVKELDKMYQAGAPEDDMRERAEEMERMREHIFREADLNRDGLISFQEFLEQTRKPEFQQDQGWDGLDQQRVYTPEEYQEFERRRMEEVQQLIAQGMLPPHPQMGHPQQMGGMPPPHPSQQFPRQQGIPQQQGVPQQYYAGQAPPQQQYHPGQAPPQQQYHPGQVQQQYQQGQVPQQQYQGQAPPPQQQYQQAPQQQQYQAPPQQLNQQGQQNQQAAPQQQQYQPPARQQNQQIPPQQQNQQAPPQQNQQAAPQQQNQQVPQQPSQQQYNGIPPVAQVGSVAAAPVKTHESKEAASNNINTNQINNNIV